MIDRANIRLIHTAVGAKARTAKVFIRDRVSKEIILQILNNLHIHDAEVVPGGIENAIEALAEQPSPQLLIVDISGVENPVARIEDLSHVCEAHTGVVVVGDRNDIALYRDLKAAGVVDYHCKPLFTNQVLRSCNNALSGELAPDEKHTGTLVFVLGVRGGVGATTVAVNTAWQLASRQERWVMLVDLDLQNGDAALQLDAVPNNALCEAFEDPTRVDKLFLERAAIHVVPRLDLLASLEPLGEATAYNETAVLSLLEMLLDRYRFVVVELPTNLAAIRLMRSVPMFSTWLLVSSGTLTSAREVARWRNIIGPTTSKRTILYVLNQHGGAGSIPEAEFDRVSGHAPDFHVSYDSEIANASRLGIKGIEKSAALRRGLAPLVHHLSGAEFEAPRSLLSRILGK